MGNPVAIDLYCGLGGWTEGLLLEGYDVIGFDIERHEYGEHRYPGQLVLQDVLTLHGSQFADATLIVASPPCQAYSYMAMPWSRAKAIRRGLKENLNGYSQNFPDGYTGPRTVTELNALFNACFRIQREACEAAGKHIPLIVENVRGAQEWVGRARWNYGSYYLWGDVPALMPMSIGRKNNGGSWFNIAHNTTSGHGQNPDGRKMPGNNATKPGKGRSDALRNYDDGRKEGGDWWNAECRKTGMAQYGSKSTKRKMASAMIAKIPPALARHIGAVYADRIRSPDRSSC